MEGNNVTQEIKRRLDIVQVISEYIPTKKAGSSYKACCPFHNEKSPSMFISPEKQMWHCFGCGEGGDVFAFVMKMDGMEFRDALRHLGKKAGVELTEQTRQQSSEKSVLIEANTLAMKFWHQVLMKTADAKVAREYVKKRQLSEETVTAFGIGFAPDTWDSLKNALAKKGVTDAVLLKAGLASAREDGKGCYDRFRGRVMFPIRDVHGDVVGFTGRVMPGPDGKDPKDTGKYVNSPQTLVYNKSAVLFALDRAKHEIKRRGYAVIVEGNMDAIASHQAGVTNVVASSGTAFTDEQMVLLKRFTSKLVLSFDADAAGELAARRSIDTAISHGFSVRVLQLPEGAGKDPDDCIRKDVTMWEKAIADAVPYMQWYIDKARPKIVAADPQEKAQLAEDLLKELAKIVEPVEQAEWVRVLAAIFSTPEGMLYERLQVVKKMSSTREQRYPLPNNPSDFAEQSSLNRRGNPIGQNPLHSRAASQTDGLQDHSTVKSLPKPAGRQGALAQLLIGVVLRWPELKKVFQAKITPAIVGEGFLPLYNEAIAAYSRNDRAEGADIIDSALQREIAQCTLLAEKDFSEYSPEDRAKTFVRLTDELVKLSQETRKRELVQLMAFAEKTRDSAKMLQIQEELRQLLSTTENI